MTSFAKSAGKFAFSVAFICFGMSVVDGWLSIPFDGWDIAISTIATLALIEMTEAEEAA